MEQCSKQVAPELQLSRLSEPSLLWVLLSALGRDGRLGEDLIEDGPDLPGSASSSKALWLVNIGQEAVEDAAQDS